VGRLAGLVPELTAPLLHAVQSTVLPAPDGDDTAVPGRELHPTLPGPVFSALTSLGRAAATRFNELGRMPASDGGNRGSDPGLKQRVASVDDRRANQRGE
jgi:hypothetical protein